MFSLKVYRDTDITGFCDKRDGEARVWQAISFLNQQQSVEDALKDAAQFGIKYVLLGLPEDIGPRANLGCGGADLGWHAFLTRFLNLQANRFLPSEKVLLLGELDCQQEQTASQQANTDVTSLRQLCSQLDEKITPILKAVFNAGLEPVIIGGGHNNCYPIIKALYQSSQRQISAVNFDPHADFRTLEGRHSGNGFHYAHHEKMLKHYHVLGLHEHKNNEAIYNAMESAGFNYTSYQAIKVRKEVSFENACRNVKAEVTHLPNPLGIEVDVDAISRMPVSAYTNCGFSVNEVEHFIYTLAQHGQTRYLHLCEAAPSTHAGGITQGLNEAGQVLSALVCSYLSSRESR